MNIPGYKVLGLSALILLLSACGSSSSDNNDVPPPPSNDSNQDDNAGNDDETTGGWALVWSDEFDGEAIDTSKWSHEVNCWGGGNYEEQCYTDNPANSYVLDNQLVIEAREEQICGPAHNQEDPAYNADDTSVCKDYSSARLRTRDKGDWTYGRMEVRALMPQGLAMWPAIWMLPTDTSIYGGWPHSGEIDIFEAFSPGTTSFDPELNTLHGTLHYGFSWPWNQYTGASYIPQANIWDEFHTYAVEWEQGEIRWYVDDVHFATNGGNWFTYHWAGQDVGYQVSTDSQPFDQPFHIILNLAIGGNAVQASPDESVPFPQQMVVDYVRVYECSANPVTGVGCATEGNPEVAPTEIEGHVAPPDEREELVMYQDGTAAFSLQDMDLVLTPGFYDIDGAATVNSDPAYAEGDDIVWDIRFVGGGNAFLTSGEGLNLGDNLNSRAKNLGEIKFDLRVVEIDPDTQLHIKIDSGWPNLSFHEIDTPPTGEWTEVAVRLYSMAPNDLEAGAVDYPHVINPFVIEPVGGDAHVQLNNIRLVCLAGDDDCGGIRSVESAVELTEDFDIFIDAVDPLWGETGQWAENPAHVQVSVVNALDPDRGQVIDGQFTLDGPNGLFFIQTPAGIVRDLSAFSDGYLAFDVQVLDYGNASGLVVKADCVNPCSSGDISLGKVGDGEWETVVVSVAGSMGTLDLEQVDTPFAIMPPWGEQTGGIHLQVDNVRWLLEDPR